MHFARAGGGGGAFGSLSVWVSPLPFRSHWAREFEVRQCHIALYWCYLAAGVGHRPSLLFLSDMKGVFFLKKRKRTMESGRSRDSERASKHPLPSSMV